MKIKKCYVVTVHGNKLNEMTLDYIMNMRFIRVVDSEMEAFRVLNKFSNKCDSVIMTKIEEHNKIKASHNSKDKYSISRYPTAVLFHKQY